MNKKEKNLPSVVYIFHFAFSNLSFVSHDFHKFSSSKQRRKRFSYRRKEKLQFFLNLFVLSSNYIVALATSAHWAPSHFLEIKLMAESV